jgi:thiol-disulfide isomerase/thioredoxin
MSRSRNLPTLAFVMLLFGPPVAAQERPPGRFESLESLNAAYDKQLHDLECHRIADLAALAGKAAAPEADAAYRQLFGLAIARGLCPEAQAAAARCRASAAAGRDVRALAALVQVLAHADRGQHDRAIDDWKALLSAPATNPRTDAELVLAVGEAYLQRLIRDGRYDVARTWCDLACSENAPAEVKDHFEDRKARLDWIGKPAPPISARDVDGKPVSLAELEGKVILIDFWATWCPPCVAAIPVLDAMAQKYRDRGFVILGVNVDAMHEDVQEASKALPLVRRFLVRHRVTWTNLLNGQGASDFAAAYRVEQIPANFLVDRAGRIVAVEQSGERLEQAVVRALGGPKDRTDQPRDRTSQ